MEYSFSMSFKDFSFRNELSKFILEKFKTKSIEYNHNYEWHKTNKKEVFNVECDQIQFNLKESGQLILQNMNNSLPRIYGGKITMATISLLKEFIESVLCYSIVEGGTQPWLDAVLQNSEEIDRWERRSLNFPPYIQILPTPNYVEGAPGMDMIPKEYISIESLPGHYHQMNYDDMLWFGSCWQMYFSTIYYKYIPKPLFDEFDDCYENIVLEYGLRKITLFENPEDFDLPENRARQWAFRRQLGIDSIAHELTKASNRIEPENLPVLITKQNCQIGKTKVTRFLNTNNKLVASNLAFKKEIKEYLDDGITVVFEELILL